MHLKDFEAISKPKEASMSDRKYGKSQVKFNHKQEFINKFPPPRTHRHTILIPTAWQQEGIHQKPNRIQKHY